MGYVIPPFTKKDLLGYYHILSSCSLSVNFSTLFISAVLCQNGDIRLRGGNSSNVGLVEICYDETWGAVCDTLWDDVDAGVTCAQLGFAPVGKIIENIMYNIIFSLIIFKVLVNV